MNRSNRLAGRQAKFQEESEPLDSSSISQAYKSHEHDRNTPIESVTSSSGLPSTVAEYFPEFNVKEPDSSPINIILPEPLPPLPPSLTKIYNTRKRTSYESFPESSSSIPSSSSSNLTDSHQNHLQQNQSQKHSRGQNDSSNTSKPVIIPGFVSKLYRMVDESTSNLITWGMDGKSFVVASPEDFSRHVLPLFFKHNNFSSFVRQLNMYGFHKVPHLQQGSMAASSASTNISTIWEFSHISFIRNRPDLLINVRRKIGKEDDGIGNSNESILSKQIMSSSASSSSAAIGSGSSDDFMATARTLRQELHFIHQQQAALRTDLISLQRDNQLLWNENLASRERHLQQQQVIDRILRFLASVFTADGKILPSNANAFSALQSNLNSTSPSSSVSSTTGGATSSSLSNTPNQRIQRPLLLGNVSGNEEELRRQVLELISNSGSNGSSAKINLLPNSDDALFLSDFNSINRIKDLDSTTNGISDDISIVDDEFSNVLKTKGLTGSDDSQNFDDVDFSSYLNCQSLE